MMYVSCFQGPSNTGELDYTKQGDSYRELVTLLKEKSPKFAEMIDKQAFNLKVGFKQVINNLTVQEPSCCQCLPCRSC